MRSEMVIGKICLKRLIVKNLTRPTAIFIVVVAEHSLFMEDMARLNLGPKKINNYFGIKFISRQKVEKKYIVLTFYSTHFKIYNTAIFPNYQ